MQFSYLDHTSLKPIVDYLVSLKSPHTVIIRKPNRSLDQNALLHTNLQIIADYTGYTPHECKLIVKEGITKKWKLEMVTSKATSKLDFRDYKSTKDLTTAEFSTLMDYVFELWETMWLTMKRPDNWLIEFATDLFS